MGLDQQCGLFSFFFFLTCYNIIIIFNFIVIIVFTLIIYTSIKSQTKFDLNFMLKKEEDKTYREWLNYGQVFILVI